jgi:hypothetical protein
VQWEWWSMVIRVRVAWVHPQIRRLLDTPRGAVFVSWGTLALGSGGLPGFAKE